MLTTSKNNSIEASSPIQEAKGEVETSGENLERTLGLLSCTENLESIINLIKEEGFDIINTKTTQFTLEQAQELYADHKAQNNYDKMVNWLSGGSNICALVLEKENAVKDWKHLMGPANYKKARKVNPKSIRALFGKDASRNATHGSDSDASAKKEIDFVFGDNLIYATDKPLFHMQVQPNVGALENGQMNGAKDTKNVKEQEVASPLINDAVLPVEEDTNNKSDDKINVDLSVNSIPDENIPSSNKESIDAHKNIELTQNELEKTTTTVSNESIPDEETEAGNPISVGTVDDDKIETPSKTSSTALSDAEQAEDVQVEKTSIEFNSDSEESQKNKDNKDDEKSVGVTKVEGSDPIENATPSCQDNDTTEATNQLDESEKSECEIIETCHAVEDKKCFEEEKEESTTATPSSERSEVNLTATNSTDLDTEKEEESKVNDITKDTEEESTPEKVVSVTEGVTKKEESENESQTRNLKENSKKKTNSAKEPKKEIATSRIKPPNSINRARSSAPTTSTSRQITANSNKTSKAGTTRIARLSPSATLNKDTEINEKKKTVSSTRDNGVPSVAKKAVTRVSKNLPRVALMASQKPSKIADKSEEEQAEKKPKKRTSSTRSFISRLTAPTVASANKKTDSDTSAVAPVTNTPKRSSLPSKRSSTVRPMVSSSKDSPLRNKQKKETATNDKQEQPAGNLNTTKETVENIQQQQEPLST